MPFLALYIPTQLFYLLHIMIFSIYHAIYLYVLIFALVYIPTGPKIQFFYLLYIMIAIYIVYIVLVTYM